MNQQNMMLLAAAVAISLYMIKGAKAAPASTASTGAKEIKTQGDASGWRYFTDGTAIGPDGTYYNKGNMVYDPLAEWRDAF